MKKYHHCVKFINSWGGSNLGERWRHSWTIQGRLEPLQLTGNSNCHVQFVMLIWLSFSPGIFVDMTPRGCVLPWASLESKCGSRGVMICIWAVLPLILCIRVVAYSYLVYTTLPFMQHVHTPHTLLTVLSGQEYLLCCRYGPTDLPRVVSGRRADRRSAPAADSPRGIWWTVSRNYTVWFLSRDVKKYKIQSIFTRAFDVA